MKPVLFLSLLLALSFLQKASAQKLYGCVYEQNSNRKVVPLVTIKAARANAVVSGTDGHFTLVFPEMKPGMPVQMNAQKAGWRIVDPSNLEVILPIESISYLHGIVMCREAEWNKKNADVTAIISKEMSEVKKALKNLEKKNQPTEAQIALQTQSAAQMARAINSVNQDMVSDSERIAYELVRQDSIEKAIQVRAQLESEKNFEPAMDAALAGNSRNLEIHRRNLVEQSRLALIEFAFDKADSTLAFLAMHDSLEFKSVYEYASFLQQQQQYDKAIEFCKKAAAVAATVFDKMRVWNNLGELYQLTGTYALSEQILNQALDSTRVLADSNMVVSEAYRAIILNNLGRLYKTWEKYSAAEKAFKTVYNIRKKQVLTDPVLFKPQLAAILLNLGAVYNDNGNYEAAEVSYNQALKQYEEMSLAEPDTYDPQIADLHNNLGILQTGQKNFGSAESHLNKALVISRRLAAASPLLYRSDIAETLLNLGDLYRKTKEYHSADQHYQEALTLRQEMARNNTAASAANSLVAVQLRLGQLRMDEKDAAGAAALLQETRQAQLKLAESTPISMYGPQLAKIEYNLGEMYRQQPDGVAAEKMYQHALDVRKELADTGYTNTFEKALIYLSLGILYKDQKNYSSAEANLQQSYDINKRLAADSADGFAEDAANNQLLAADQLGLTLFLQERYDAAARMQLEAISIAQRLSQTNLGLYEDNIANLQLNLGNTYFKKSDFVSAQQSYWVAAISFQKLKNSKPAVYGSSFCKMVAYLGKLESRSKLLLNKPVYLKMLAEAMELEPTLTDTTVRRQLKEVQQAMNNGQ